MSADLAEFLITYYTPENGLVLDQFCGRGTIGLALCTTVEDLLDMI